MSCSSLKQERSSGEDIENPDKEYLQNLPLYNAVDKGNWKATEKLIQNNPNLLIASLSADNDRALHVAVLAGHVELVAELVNRLSPKELAIKNEQEATALNYAAIGGITEIAEYLVKKNENLVAIQNQHNQIPVVVASLYGHDDMVRFLYEKTPKEELSPAKGKNGVMLITTSIVDERYEIALDLLRKYPELAFERDDDNDTPLEMLAQRPSAFFSGHNLSRWKLWIYNCIRIAPLHAFNNQTGNGSPNGKILFRPISRILFKHLYDLKKTHTEAQELLRLICKQLSTFHILDLESAGVYNAIFHAVKNGIVEVIIEVTTYPDVIWCTDKYERNIFSYATFQRQEKVFSLFYKLGAKKSSLAAGCDNNNNNILHQAAILAPPSRLDLVAGAALQMQRELQWFQEVKSIAQPKYSEMLNGAGKTPGTLFSEEHKELVDAGEKWMKDTAESSTVVAALIATIMFSAIFTAPGGFDQNGLPLYLNQNLFMVFIVSDAMSLFASTSSLLIFLGILTTRYREEDFLEALPRKLIAGLFTLFFSIATMMITFGVTLFIYLHKRIPWVSFPIIMLASLPVTLFALQQFPLLYRVIWSTYGPSFFDKPKKGCSRLLVYLWTQLLRQAKKGLVPLTQR